MHGSRWRRQPSWPHSCRLRLPNRVPGQCQQASLNLIKPACLRHGPVAQAVAWNKKQPLSPPTSRMFTISGNVALRGSPVALRGSSVIRSSLQRSSLVRKGSAALVATPLLQAQRVVAAMAAAQKRVLVPIGNGSEEMEAVITIDVLRRAGASVTVASVEQSLECTCSRGVKIVADQLIQDAAKEQYDLVACPGGMPGAERLRDSPDLLKLVEQQKAAGRFHAAICATPAVFFEAKGIIGDKRATAHPAFSDKLANQAAVADRVVVDGKLTTSRGPGTAFEFALSLVQQLYGEEKAREVAGPMVMYDYKL